ncbi:MAG: hypothetical protein HY719_08080, partial [Planctomycetes bacterium]|nr:hypothetical protein [Planctomycetota bacterium]
MTRIFGTDGIRGVAGRGFFVPETLARAGQALGHILGSGRGARGAGHGAR